MEKTLYIGCPEKVFTGGAELAHQLCYELNRAGQSAKMYYYPLRAETPKLSVWHTVAESQYGIYQTECAESIEEIDQAGNVLILPETAVERYSLFHSCKIHFWWMSVDHYFMGVASEQLQEQQQMLRRKEHLHFIQSEYAWAYCRDKLQIAERQMYWLTDYINPIYLEMIPVPERKDYIFFNPKKSLDMMKAIVQKYPDYSWVPLQGFTPKQMAKMLNLGKIYIDFGYHPGRDRIPREAAAKGCCIITNRAGAAANEVDIPIDGCYKFQNPLAEIEQVMHLVDNILVNYSEHIRHFGRYRLQIKCERKKFLQEVLQLKTIVSEE